MTHTDDDIETCRECETAPARKIKALTESNRELLEALEAAHAALYKAGAFHRDHPTRSAFEQAEAAINKAKARTQP
jgi:uncharacterized membrane protein YccC